LSLPTRLGNHSLAEVQTWLAQGRLALHTGPLVSRIRCNLPDVARSLHVLYAEHPCQLDPVFADFHAELRQPRNLRRWFRPQVQFLTEGDEPFEPLPRAQAPAMLEWGLNWMLAASAHQWLNIHAASLEREGQVVVLPAPPGSGKSTLCAVLALRGWRLLSDELTLLDPDTLKAHALARPINLKNKSIDVIKAFEPRTVWAPETYDTAKGRVTHLKPPVSSVRRMLDTGSPRWIVFPRYEPDAKPQLSPRGKVATFNHFAQNAFNYSVLGEVGFDAVGRLVDQCDCYDFVYSQLDDALEVFDWLAQGGTAIA
jgi:HprK-related kinase A